MILFYSDFQFNLRAAMTVAIGCDFAAMRFDHHVHIVQSQAESFAGTALYGKMAPVILLKNVWQIGRRDTKPVIFNPDPQLFLDVDTTDVDVYFRAGVEDGVFYQIVQRSGQMGFVGRNG